MSDVAMPPREKWLSWLQDARGRTMILAGGCAAFLLLVMAGAYLLGDAGLRTNFMAKSRAPSLIHLFGTDPLGRDLFARTVKGLALSIWIGLLAASASASIALLLALAAVTLGRTADAVVGLLVDMFLGIPHLVLLIMIAFAMGGGITAVVTAVALTHWPMLTRILRAELMQVLRSDYVLASRHFGKSWWFVARQHLLPHALPQLLVGLVLLFPHAILHEAALTFIGFGIEPSRPAIGTLLSEALRSLAAGQWWLGVFPGLALLLVVLAFDGVAGGVRASLSARLAQD